MRQVQHPVCKARSAFTLIEILVVLAIIALLSALLFPAFSRAREGARQASCQTNLQQIYLATQQYFQDERRYPDSLLDLLPNGAAYDNGATPSPTLPPNVNGYLKSGSDGLLCPDDSLDNTVAHSSYGFLGKNPAAPLPTLRGASADPNADAGKYVWNYWGYDTDGFAYATSADAATATNSDPNGYTLLMNPESFKKSSKTTITGKFNHPRMGTAFDADVAPSTNILRHSLANRFAPTNTIITHCVWHRLQTANDIVAPGQLGYGGDPQNARDIVLRLDGTTKPVNVANWKADATGNKWQTQTP